MKPSARQLRQLATRPVKEGVRLIALVRLAEADAAHARVQRDADDEALHDFRVALRRLRSIWRSYRPWLRESVDRRSARRLRRIARASNPCRDLEALIERARGLTDVGEAGGTAVTLLVQRFEAERSDAAHAFRRDELPRWPALARKLTVSLSSYTTTLNLGRTRPELLGTNTARLALTSCDELVDRLRSVLTIEHQTEAHDARIAGKQLRYLLEPFATEVKECAHAVAACKRMQDDLGELHDLHVLMTTVEQTVAVSTTAQHTALLTVLDAVRSARAAIYEHVRQTYVASEAATLTAAARDAAAALERAARVGREIERKFLLRRCPRLTDADAVTITQGYVPGERIRERVRKVEAEGGTTYYRTLKAGRGVERMEIEEETSQDVFRSLYALTKGHRIRKRRYRVAVLGLTWEIDRFLDRNLCLAEVELPSRNTRIEFPSWLRHLVIREVTNEREYLNETLAR